jgi:hypothetical protein
VAEVDKLPDIIQMKPEEVVKSLKQMFSDKEALLELDGLKEHENVLIAEIQAIEEESKIVELA